MILSIIIVAYRSEVEIQNCLSSIPLDIAGVRCEVVVVNNSSSDTTGSIVSSRYPYVKYIEPPQNLGFGKANNLGFRRSSGEVVLFLNPDTICSAKALEWCARRIISEPDIGLISPKLELADGSMDLACRRSIPTIWDGFCRAVGLSRLFPKVACFNGYNLTHLSADGTYSVGAINGAFMMTRREVLEEVGLFDEKFFMYGDDLDLCIRVAQAGYRIVYDGRVAITHLKGLSVARDFEQMSQAIFDANRDVYLKHFNPRGSRWVRFKYQAAFGAWKRLARLRANLMGYRKVKPL